MAEPVEKKPRRTRTIELDLERSPKWPKWVEDAEDSALLELFEIGVKVKGSFAINITENSEYIEKILGEKLNPVYQQINAMSTQFVKVQNGVTTSLTNMQSGVMAMNTKLVGEVQEVARKVPPLDSLNSKINEVLRPVQRCDDNLIKLVNKYENPAIKGALGEAEVLTILRDHFPNYTIRSVAGQGRKADIEITSAQSSQKYLVEVKDHERAVPAKEIEKFKKNVSDNKVKVGILFSLRSGISVHASHGRFTIKFEDNQYYIYVPNALKERKDLIVWIVVLADQLAVLNQGLTDTQTKVVTNLLTEFQQSMDRSKNCKTHLEALKGSVAALEENMEPLLKVIQNAKTKLNSALNKNS